MSYFNEKKKTALNGSFWMMVHWNALFRPWNVMWHWFSLFDWRYIIWGKKYIFEPWNLIDKFFWNTHTRVNKSCPKVTIMCALKKFFQSKEVFYLILITHKKDLILAFYTKQKIVHNQFILFPRETIIVNCILTCPLKLTLVFTRHLTT